MNLEFNTTFLWINQPNYSVSSESRLSIGDDCLINLKASDSNILCREDNDALYY